MSLREQIRAHRAEADRIEILLRVRLDKLKSKFLCTRMDADVVRVSDGLIICPAGRKLVPGLLKRLANLEDASQVRLDPYDKADPEYVKKLEESMKEAMTP